MPNDQLPWYRKFEFDFSVDKRTRGFAIICAKEDGTIELGIFIWKYLIGVEYHSKKTVFDL